jgi:hypothetical protein
MSASPQPPRTASSRTSSSRVVARRRARSRRPAVAPRRAAPPPRRAAPRPRSCLPHANPVRLARRRAAPRRPAQLPPTRTPCGSRAVAPPRRRAAPRRPDWLAAPRTPCSRQVARLPPACEPTRAARDKPEAAAETASRRGTWVCALRSRTGGSPAGARRAWRDRAGSSSPGCCYFAIRSWITFVG